MPRHTMASGFRQSIAESQDILSQIVTGSDILSLMESKIGNFVFHIFMFTADFQKPNELAPKITAKK